ncbi:alpha/beta hydrolase [Candidatus Epulonipiscium viviparus]|uniref:alpha/beta hydrolase n=1 Tax=Candidatus Epulonipiscium viviparus TaxID=420336 RepID=UPI002738056A|nr:alpha/beta hydrolase-fold protein [Candidatus Epulopiscium viviparus]
MKKSLTFLMLTTMALGISNIYAVEQDTAKFVRLDNESWHFKEYRTYNHMFGLLPYTKDGIATEDIELAVVPSSAVFKTWETLNMPTNDDHAGFEPLTKNDGTPLFKQWSETWVATEFKLPENFTNNEDVTLILGVIDDADVVYINGQPVASSGFINHNKEAIINTSSTGGFNYNPQNSEDSIVFEKSYWEINREYSIPADILNEGGTNEIAIRVFNNNGDGGFYVGDGYAICSDDIAVRKIKGLPTINGYSEEFEEIINAQKKAIEDYNFTAYARTVMPNYMQNFENKSDYLLDFKNNYSEGLSVIDADQSFWLDDNGVYSYEANRKIIDASNQVVLDADITQYFSVIDDVFYEQGNMSHCYTTTYDSALFKDKNGKSIKLSYNIYLPPSYYENTSKQYPVVYLLHGINSSSKSFVTVDKIESFLNEQIQNGNIMEMIVVMPDSGLSSWYADTEYNPTNLNGTGPWASHITSEIRSEIENNYRTINEAEFRGLTGISMGGHGAMTLGLSNPDLYSSIASHMGALSDSTLSLLKSLNAEQMKAYDFYLDCGLQDTAVDYQNTVKTHEYLLSIEKDHEYSLRNGGHNSAFYMIGMVNSFKMHSDHFRKNMETCD